MLDLLLNHSPTFLVGELMLGLSLGLFGVALAGTVRERYSIRVRLRGGTDAIGEAARRVPSDLTSAESRSGRIGPIILEAKQTGERSAGNPHAPFDEAGAGNAARPRRCDTRRRKSEPTGNTNFGLNRRVSPRPYR